MLNIRVNLDNFWRSVEENQIVNYVCKDWNVSKNKSLELQISKWGSADCLLDLNLDLRWRGRSHAGPELTVQVWSYFFCIKLYDHRHWDYDKNRWQVYDEADYSEYGKMK